MFGYLDGVVFVLKFIYWVKLWCPFLTYDIECRFLEIDHHFD